ncbi:MAG TPA: phosphatidylglycerophosphatase A [Candidatus Acidoferrales bacterium]|nr:phosphatidylglycerophosphatase A [Candidatus Acidoferrales bacterium]
MAAKTATMTEKSRAALALATVAGLGRVPLVPGTFGSLAGLGVALLIARLTASGPGISRGFLAAYLLANAAIAGAGVWAASRAADYLGHKDPPAVVIDEVSGQMIALAGHLAGVAAVNWKSLAAGFILFRGFDILKPFPARRAEWLPGGWGVMADDWIAGCYAAIVLWAIRMLLFR